MIVLDAADAFGHDYVAVTVTCGLWAHISQVWVLSLGKSGYEDWHGGGIRGCGQDDLAGTSL